MAALLHSAVKYERSGPFQRVCNPTADNLPTLWSNSPLPYKTKSLKQTSKTAWLGKGYEGKCRAVELIRGLTVFLPAQTSAFPGRVSCTCLLQDFYADSAEKGFVVTHVSFVKSALPAPSNDSAAQCLRAGMCPASTAFAKASSTKEPSMRHVESSLGEGPPWEEKT